MVAEGNGHRPSAAGPPGHDHSRCIPEPHLPRHRAEDRPAGADHAERHELPGVREHPEPRTPPQARDEYGGTDSHRTARRRARGCRTPRSGPRATWPPARRFLGLDPQLVEQQIAAAAAPQRRAGDLDGPPHLAGTGTRNVHHSERPGDHAPTVGVTADQVQQAIAKMRSGAEPTACRGERCLPKCSADRSVPVGAGAAGGARGLPGRIWKQLYRVRAPRRQRHRGADQDGPVRSGLR